MVFSINKEAVKEKNLKKFTVDSRYIFCYYTFEGICKF